jgi:hypothetical protein
MSCVAGQSRVIRLRVWTWVRIRIRIKVTPIAESDAGNLGSVSNTLYI